MIGGDLKKTSGPATVDVRGTMPAEAFRQFSGTPPTDPTGPIPTTGASGTYSEATVITVVSSVTPSIINLRYRRCHDIGHASNKVLVPLLHFPGFSGSDAEFSDAHLRRHASYMNPTTGRAFLPIALSTRGRDAVGGSISYVKDTQDAFDILEDAAAAVTLGGATVYGEGRCAVLVGYSTGVYDALLALVRCPDRVLGVIGYFGNWDLGRHDRDTHWQLRPPATRATLITQIGDRGFGTEAELAPYVARDAASGVARTLAHPGAPHLWWIGDEDEANSVGLSKPSRFLAMMNGNLPALAKVHPHVSNALSATRYLHDAGINSAAAVAAESFWATGALAAEEFLMPAESPPGGIPVRGWVRKRAFGDAVDPKNNTPGFELWMGETSPPRTSDDGGKKHAADVRYADRRFEVTPITSTAGFVQILSEDNNRIVALSPPDTTVIDLDSHAAITDLAADLGYTHQFRADDPGVVGVGQVTLVPDSIGALSATAPADATAPSLQVDGDTITYLQFARTSDLVGQKLSISSLQVDPNEDFTFICACSTPTDVLQWLFSCAHHGSSAEFQVFFHADSNAIKAGILNDDGSSALAGDISTAAFSLNTKHFVAVVARTDAAGRRWLFIMLDGLAISETEITGMTFTTTGTNTTYVGAGWANGAGVPYRHGDWRVYAWASKPGASSLTDLLAAYAIYRSEFVLP